MDQTHIREFWDARAREDAYFFIDDTRTYRDPDLAEFWVRGEADLEAMFEVLGVGLRDTESVLDIGCGVGRLTRIIAARAAWVYGMDVSAEMIGRARRHHADLRNIDWIVGDGASLRPLGDASVDVCISYIVFQHIPDPRITLGYVSEMGRVLRPGGWAAFQVSNDRGVHWRRTNGLRAPSVRLASWLGRRPRGRDDPAWLGSAVDLDELRDVARDGGLEVERTAGEGTQFCLILARRRNPPDILGLRGR